MLGQLSPSLLTANLAPRDLHLTDAECILRLYDLLIVVPKNDIYRVFTLCQVLFNFSVYGEEGTSEDFWVEE